MTYFSCPRSQDLEITVQIVQTRKLVSCNLIFPVKSNTGDPKITIGAASPSSTATINNSGFKEPRTKHGMKELRFSLKI
ncbi:hypothetical protein FF38_06292 [Lucilia cuprina]|uniref:Uncharacterized protein n=1 Tax=Lucilia cuprina TaxID=7375 RepID=A0A0L0C7V0_LUCCU|nr:hypothetical protein FF38_06292 [Lucilia cuprina]